jgi:uncharacterized membrane protein
MRQMITKSLELICQIAIVVFLLGGLISGWQWGGFFGAIGGLIGAFIFSVTFFGALFVLLDISDHTRRTAEALEKKGP